MMQTATIAQERKQESLAVQWLGHNLPAHWPQASMQHVYVRARNSGAREWRAKAGDEIHVKLVVRVKGQVHVTLELPHDVLPGGEVTFNFPFLVPPLFFKSRDQMEMTFGLTEDETPFGEPLNVQVEIGAMEQDFAAETLQVAVLTCCAFYLPSGGVSRGRDGKLYPLVASHASGCRVRDVQGNEWIDYVMGWGSALLGYSRAEIRDAIARQLESAAIIALPHVNELEVAQLLCEMIPCAEMTLFGKNGSDVCTAAVRMARTYTGRPTILFSGYSGWQDPFAQVFESALAQEGHRHSAFRFAANDLEGVTGLFDEHHGQVAAVILEPAAQVETVDGPIREADAEFLQGLSALCHKHGALLIYDEIFTGFRYPGGSVQKATGVLPDLTCLGKALSSGMPLSALVGRREIMKSVSRIFYHPTFKGEAYSFAAAAAALKIHQSEDVPGHIHQFGSKLMAAVNDVSRRLGIDGQLTGPAFRMIYRFNEPDESRRTLLRTLLLQELLKHGLLPFRGCFIPSTAHGARELEQTIEAFEASLQRVREVADSNRFERELEIAPVV